MPRLFHRPPQYRLHKSTKQAIVSLAGKRIYLGPYGSARSHQKYQEVIQAWQAARQERPAAVKSRDEALVEAITPATLREKRRHGLEVTINELVLVYRRHTHQYYCKHGKITREAETIDEAIRLVRSKHGRQDIMELGPVALEEMREQMIDELDWSRKYINKQVRRIIAMFRWAAQKELCPGAVPESLRQLTGLKKGRTQARETPGVSCVADKVVDQTILHLPEVVADMVRFQRLTGARPGEVCSLRPRDIDRSQEIWVYSPPEHKTEHFEKGRMVVIGPQAQKVLLPYLVRASDSTCFSPAESERRRREIARSKRRTPNKQGNSPGTNRVIAPRRPPKDSYSTDSYRRAIHRACQRHNIEKWSPNQLRHSTATDVRKRFGLEAAQVICGHQSADITQVYAERNLDLARQVAREVG